MNMKKMLITGAVTLMGIYGGHIALDNYLQKDASDAKLNQLRMGYSVPVKVPGEAEYSKYMQENEQEFYKIKRDMVRYGELKNIPQRSEKLESELKTLSEKIEKEYGLSIKDFGLYVAKAKLADLNHVGIDDISVYADLKESEDIFVKNKVTDKLVMQPNSKMEIKKLLLDVAKYQNAPFSADNAYKMMSKTIEVANNTYKMSKDGKNMMEVSTHMQTRQAKEVAEEIR